MQPDWDVVGPTGRCGVFQYQTGPGLSHEAWPLPPVMRSRSTSVILAACFIGVLGCSKPSPPTSQLAQLLATNAPCRVRLDPPWVGKAVDTVRTGLDRKNPDPPDLARLKGELRFDWFSFSDQSSPWHFGPKTISRSEGGETESAIYTWRASLPSDSDLVAASTVSELEKFLGPPQGFHDMGAGWAFFTLGKSDEVETVSISCFTPHRYGGQWVIDSLQVTRGKVRPERP